MKTFLRIIFFFITLALTTTGAFASNLQQQLQNKLNYIKSQFAPDSRLELFNVEITGTNARIETTSVKAKQAVLSLAKEFSDYNIEALLYPEENQELEGKWRALVNHSTIQLQKGPDYATEWSTQSLMGTPVRILKKTRSYWILIQNYDGYIGYTTRGSVQPLTEAEFAEWNNSVRVIWVKNFGSVYAEPTPDSSTISDIVAGNILVWLNEEIVNGYRHVKTPDGRFGWIQANGSMEWEDWKSTRELTSDNLIASARRLLGHPYVWGGTSTKGVDCSGMVNFAFSSNGYNILRDVSQIQREGIEIDITEGWQSCQPGDLLIFGKKRSDGTTSWRHVGLYIGDGRFIHSATVVHESSLDPNSPDYDPGNAKELIKVVRMLGAPNTDYFHPISQNKFFSM